MQVQLFLTRYYSLIDTVLALDLPEETIKLKRMFGVEKLTHIEDFVALLTYPLGAWQAQNWDASVSSTGFSDFCDAMAGKRGDPSPSQRSNAQIPLIQQPTQNSATTFLERYAYYIKWNVVPYCRPGQGQTLDDCFGTFNDEEYQQTGLDQTWRSWTWQYCTGGSV
jgi:hypothetical protein